MQVVREMNVNVFATWIFLMHKYCEAEKPYEP